MFCRRTNSKLIPVMASIEDRLEDPSAAWRAGGDRVEKFAERPDHPVAHRGYEVGVPVLGGCGVG